MNSSNFFNTEDGSSYLFDINQQQLLNVHPVVEEILNFSHFDNDTDLYTYIKEKNPKLTNSEIDYYQKKI